MTTLNINQGSGTQLTISQSTGLTINAQQPIPEPAKDQVAYARKWNGSAFIWESITESQGGIEDVVSAGFFVRSLSGWVNINTLGYLTAITGEMIALALGYVPSDFDGNYNSLTNIPITFPPSSHGHLLSDVDGLTTALSGKENAIASGTTSQYWRGDKSWQTLDKNTVGLGNVPNTDCSNASNISSGTLARARQQNIFIEKHFTGTIATGTYLLFVSPYNGTIVAVVSARTTSGTASINILKEGVLVNGLDAIAVSSSELSSDDLAISNNTLVKGNRVQVQVVSVSSAVDLFVQIELQLS